MKQGDMISIMSPRCKTTFAWELFSSPSTKSILHWDGIPAFSFRVEKDKAKLPTGTLHSKSGNKGSILGITQCESSNTRLEEFGSRWQDLCPEIKHRGSRRIVKSRHEMSCFKL